MRFKKILTLFLAAIMLFSSVLPLTSCKDDPDTQDPDNGGSDAPAEGTQTTYTVRVQTVGGMAMEGVQVWIHSGDGWLPACPPQETDENGIASFSLLASSDYSVQITGVPEGYNVTVGNTRDERYPISGNGATVTLSSAPIKGGYVADSYELGDVMHDFTIEDINGNSYTLSEVLKEKRMVMLNFWYCECSWCLQEFPYINGQYNAFNNDTDPDNDVEIFAINDYGDSKDAVKNYCQNYGITLDMPLFQIDYGSDAPTRSRFPYSGYPTSVIIDRYGVICFIEAGAIIGESKWFNIFNHFVADDYDQRLISSAADLNPAVEPNIEFPGNEAIANSFSNANLNATYTPEEGTADAQFSWPFIPTTYQVAGEESFSCVRPSNTLDGSYSILHANVTMKAGEALVFDYFSSTQGGYDVLYVLVDGKDIYSISGINEGSWETCCTYVAHEDGTYDVSFVYTKDDADSEGDDTIYLKDLRIVSADELDVETYIFRFAATKPNAVGDGYEDYVSVVYNENDGYYHVGTANGPILLANLLGYTNFDSSATVSERLHATYELLVDINGDGVKENVFYDWVYYGSYASNSNVYNYCPVTRDLRAYLEAYCELYRGEVGKAKNDNLWLQLCAYYDAYGKDENGTPTPELKDPIKGLAPFSAYEAKEGSENQFTYTKIVIPRGYLFAFTPTVSGAYRVTSLSTPEGMTSVGYTHEVNGWIYEGTQADWIKNNSNRVVVTDYEDMERYCPELQIDNGDGTYRLDHNNVSMAAYMEAGKTYYVCFAYYELYATGTFNFELEYLGESFPQFVLASPGPTTFSESDDGGIGQYIAGGIDVIFGFKSGDTFTESNDKTALAYHLKGYDENGAPIVGEQIYADFTYVTTYFPSQSIEDLIKIDAFNFAITELDREALTLIEFIKDQGELHWKRNYIKETYFTEDGASKYDSNKIEDALVYGEYSSDEAIKSVQKAAIDAANGAYSALGLTDAALNAYIKDETLDASLSETVKNAIAFVCYEGKCDLKQYWATSFGDEPIVSTAEWADKKMSDAIRGSFSEAIRAEQTAIAESVNALYGNLWTYYKMDDVLIGKYHNEEDKTQKDIKALGYIDEYSVSAEDKTLINDSLRAAWDEEFDTVLPGADDGIDLSDITAVSNWRYAYMWDYYCFDDVLAGNFHGNTTDYTSVIKAYADGKIEPEFDEGLCINPELIGCVAVTRELADVLQLVVDHYVFEDVRNGWLKFCYYYNVLG